MSDFFKIHIYIGRKAMDKVPFRQVHLDFHTSGAIDGVGSAFDKEEFKSTLAAGHVNSITVFAKCHHGYSYYPSEVNEPHPGLKINLLGQQLEACREAGVRAPVYISAGLDEKEAVKHPEWILRYTSNGTYDFVHDAHYHTLCFNSGYLDKLLAQIDEVMRFFNPEEIFLDICDERPCYCVKCLKDMKAKGLDPNKEEDVKAFSRFVYAEYCRKVKEVVRKYNKDTVIFHNAGNIPMGRRDFAAHDDHLELESLPTGGWGYDHFPMSAAYCRNLGKEYIGMTGKFHTTWGEFGGFKHPNALIYETALSLALGAKCSVGDQLHPIGKLNPSTYNLIGKAYSQVEKKEKWCFDTVSVADVAVLSALSTGAKKEGSNSMSDVGANRILLEKKYLYDFIDTECDFGKYKLLVLPDEVKCDDALKAKLTAYIEKGGKILASGSSFAPGIKTDGLDEFCPDYMQPADEEGFVNGVTQYVMYNGSYKFTSDESFRTVAYRVNPYFNRTPEHFSSHQHTPDMPGTLTEGAVISENIGYISWNVFRDYALKGELHCKELVSKMLDALIGNERTLEVSGLPDRGIATLRYQEKESRYIAHLLFTHTSVRGKNIEIIEDTVPVFNVKVSVKLGKKPCSVTLVPENKPLDFSFENGVLSFTVPEINIHSMTEIKI